MIIASVIILGLVGVYIYNQIQVQQTHAIRENTISTEADTKAMIRNNITSYVQAERNEYSFSKLGGIYNLKISVSNTTAYLLDNVKVKVTYIKPNGEV